MYHLAIETSTAPTSVALLQNKKLIGQKFIDKAQETSIYLALYCKELLNTATIDAKELSFISVGVGPGSFTGLRAGLATAKGLAFANNTPIVAVDSLHALAYGYRHINKEEKKKHAIVALYDARRGNVYLGGMYKNGKKIKPERITFTKESIEKRVISPYFLITPHTNELVFSKHEVECNNLSTFSGRAEYTGLLGMQNFRTNNARNNEKISPAYLVDNYNNKT